MAPIIHIHHRAALHPPYMRHKSILIAIIITSSSLTGCLGEDSGGTDEIAELTEDNQSLQYEIIQLEGNALSLNENIAELNAQLSSLQESIQSLENQNSSNTEAISQLNSEIEYLQAQRDLLEAAALYLEIEKAQLEENMSIRYQEGYDTGYEDAYDASYDGVAQHYYNEGWDDGWEIANSEAQADIIDMQAIASSLNETVLALQDSVFELQTLASSLNETVSELIGEIGELTAASLVCGNSAEAMNGQCVSKQVVWGKIPFVIGTNVTFGQSFLGGFTHNQDGVYAVDFHMEEGTPIVAFKSGIVSKIKEDSDINCIDDGIDQEDCTHSNYVIIDHGDFTFAVYGHLQQYSVDLEVGDSVGSGHQIGRIGNTGYSTDPHLHLAISNGFARGFSFSEKTPLFEELRGISNGVPFSGLSAISNNSNQSLNEVFSYSHCPLDTFNFRGVELTSEIPCSVAELDVNYSLTGMVLIEGNQLHVGQWERSSEEWNYYCVETNSTGHFSTNLVWPSNDHNDSGYLMLSVAREGCYTFDSWYTSVRIYFD